ncbi:sigma factor-like helix-turn-helix DNA-binding protein, partial [Nocardiopsis lucentensis]|uniref:sigma factor-like helix-turn-helix DNA-binding protein n=1 Tax=Nocardiopsis lucentensis TaxID=53441 RepID=UPI0023A99B3E
MLGRVGADHLASGMARLALDRWEGRAPGEVMPALYASVLAGAEVEGVSDEHRALANPLWRLTEQLGEEGARKALREAFLAVLARLPREGTGDDGPRDGDETVTTVADTGMEGDRSGTGVASAEAPETGDGAEAEAVVAADGPADDAPAPAAGEPVPDGSHDTTLLDAINGWLEAGDERRRALASRRIFTDAPETLEAISSDFGVSRERVRQINKQVDQNLRSWLASPSGQPLTTHAAEVSAALGTAAPLDAFWALRPEYALRPPALDVPMGRVVLTLLPEHRVEGDWVVTEAADTLANRLADLLADRTAVPLDEVLDIVHEAGVRPEHARAWIEAQPQTRVLADHVLRWVRNLQEKAFAVLSATGRPMHVDELVEHIGGEFSEGGFRDRLHNDYRLIRRDRRVFGLRVWGGEEYLGVEGTVRRELERAGGEMRVCELAETISRRFDVTETTVRGLTAGSAFAHPRPGW